MPPAPPGAFAYLPAEAWYWNGFPLQDPNGSYNIATMGGSRFSVPVLRGQNYTVPYNAGQSWRAKFPDQRTITLSMWTDGRGTPSTFPSTDPRLSFNNNIQSLRQQFWTRNAGGSVQGQLQRNWYLTQGIPKLVTSTAMAEIAGSMDLTMNGRTDAAFSVDLLLADPYFYGAQQIQAITGTGSITGLGEGIAGEGYPSAVSSFTVKLTTACTVTNNTAGVSFTFAGGANYPVTVDILNLTAVDSSSVNWVSGITHSGSRMWMCVLPGNNSISVNNGATATFTFNDCYM